MQVKEIKKGDRIVETDYGVQFISTAIEDAHESVQDGGHGWACKCVTDVGRVIDYYQIEPPQGFPDLELVKRADGKS